MYKIINRKKLLATIVADTLIKLLFLPWRLFHREPVIQAEKIKSICIIRTAYIGDVVMTLPMLIPLKNRFPEAEITFLTSKSSAPLLKKNPYVNEILVFDPFWFYLSSKKNWITFLKNLRKRRFDMVIETRGDIREIVLIMFWIRATYKISYDVGGGGSLLTNVVPFPGHCHKVDYHLNIVAYLGGVAKREGKIIYLDEDEKKSVSRLLMDKGIEGPFIAIHPGSRLEMKRWYPERFALLCDELVQRYKLPVVLLGTVPEQKLLSTICELSHTQLVTLNGNLSIRQLAAVLECATLFICNDSAPMHIGAAVQTSTVAIFGPSKSEETSPDYLFSEVVEKDFPCRISCDESHCLQIEYNDCLKQIKVDDVLKAVERLFVRKTKFDNQSGNNQ